MNSQTRKPRTKEELQELIAECLPQFLGETAYQRMRQECRLAHQSEKVVARRLAGNLLNSYDMYRPLNF